MKTCPNLALTSLAPLAVVAIALLPACGSQKAPSAPRVAALLGEDQELFAVDWPTTMRAELEANARGSLAVVALDGQGGVRVVPRCTVDAKYVPIEVTPKEDVIRLASHDEMRAALPFASASVSGKAGGQGTEDEVLDVAVVTRSVARAPALPFSRVDLRGDCAEATHVVTGLVRGAFAVAKRKKTDAAVAAEVFGIAVGASSFRGELVAKSDGAPGACRSAPGRDPSCEALVKVTLRAVPKADANAVTSRGMFWVERTCNDCGAECARGDMDACASVAMDHLTNDDEAKAERFSRMACDGNSAAGCVGLGLVYDPLYNGKGFTDGVKAQALYAHACDMGALTGCSLLALLLDYTDEGFKLSDEAHARRAGRACTADGDPVHNGQTEACFTTARWFVTKAEHLQKSGSPGFVEVLDQAIAFEKRRCEISSAKFLSDHPCNVEQWRKLRPR